MWNRPHSTLVVRCSCTLVHFVMTTTVQFVWCTVLLQSTAHGHLDSSTVASNLSNYFITNDRPCESLPTFVFESVGRGVDLSNVDLQPRLDDLKRGFAPFREQVVALTCEHNERMILSDGQQLSLPDQVLRVLEQPQIDFTRHGIGAVDAAEYRQRQAQSFGVTMVEGAFRAAPGYRRLKRLQLSQNRIRDHVRFERLRRHLWLREVPSLRLAESVAAEFARLPEEHSDGTRAYEDFIEKFGTHFLTRISFGDAAQIEFERDHNRSPINRTTTMSTAYNESPEIGDVVTSGSDETIDQRPAEWFAELGKELIYNCSSLRTIGQLTEDKVLVSEHDRLWRLYRTEEQRWRVLSVYGGRLDHCERLNQTSDAKIPPKSDVSPEGAVNHSISSGSGRKWQSKDRLSEWASKGLRDLFSTWQERETMPWPLYGKAAPLELLLPDGPRKESFKKAVKLHLEAAELEDGN
jgi:hypothetical protein